MNLFRRNKGKKNNRKSTRMTMSLKQTIIMFVLMVCVIGLIGRLIYICCNDYSEYSINVFSNYTYNYNNSEVSAPRGTITDRNGNILAYSETKFYLILEPKIILTEDAEYLDATVQALSKICGLDKDEVLSVINDNSTSLYYRYREVNDTEDDTDTDDDTDSDSEDSTNSKKVVLLEFDIDVKTEYEDMVDAVNVSKTSAKLTALAELFDMTEEEVKATYPDYAEFQLQGVWFERQYDRVYPYGSLASDVIGFYSENYTSSSRGIENTYNTELTGVTGLTYGYMTGDYYKVTEVVEPEQGSTVVSTIDIEVQNIVQQAIDDYTSEYTVDNMAVIVMNPNNGEIIAMADDKSYNLNDPTSKPDGVDQDEWDSYIPSVKTSTLYEYYESYCVNSSYEPGSIFKPFTIAAAMEEGALLGDETFECNGYTVVDGWTIHCHNTDGCGTLDIFGALQNSCNVSLIQIANLLGKEDFNTYFYRFGFGQLTGIDLPDEMDTSSLVFKDFTEQPDVTLACASFGQGFNVTMVQMAAAMASLVNGGYYYTPHVVKEVTTADGVTTETYDTTAKFTTVSAETSEYIREALYTVVVDGTGSFVKIEGYDIGGKTGTAEKVEDGARVEDQWVLSFISVAPIENPELMVYVVIDHTSDSEWYNSSKPAQDVAKAIWSKLLPYYNIQSNLDEYDYLIPEETEATVVDSYVGSYTEASTEEEETEDEETESETESLESGDAETETAATAEENLTETAATEEVPVETAATEEVPVETVAPEEVPAETAAPEEMPIETAAPEEVPTETAAPEEVPVETAAPEEVPADTVATDTEAVVEEVF